MEDSLAEAAQKAGAKITEAKVTVTLFPDIPKDLKDWIDNASYEELLSMWRFAPIGSPYFQGATGDYYSKVMAQKRDEVGQQEHVRASKSIGWEN